MSIADPVVNISPPATPELTPVDPAPILTQPVIEQVADVAPTAADVLQAAAVEPSLAELGLANYTPVGLIQNLLEFAHMDLGLPWWGAIALGRHRKHCSISVAVVSSVLTISSYPLFCVGTVVARMAVFPLIVKGQREAAKLNNVMPEMTKLTTKMTEAKQSGNKFECKHFFFIFLQLLLPVRCHFKLAISFDMSCCLSVPVAKAYSELNMFQKKHDVNPLRGFLVPLVQVSLSGDDEILLFPSKSQWSNRTFLPSLPIRHQSSSRSSSR